MARVMKDSGILWIGKIPDEWEIVPHKYVMHKEKEICEKYNDEDIISLTMNGVIVRDLVNPTGKMPATFDGYQRVYAGNLLMCLFDIDVTPRCVGYIRNDGLTSPAYSQFVVDNGNYPQYYDYLLRMIDDGKHFLHLSKNLRSSLTEENFGAIKTIVPPMHEQKKIAEFLDVKISEIDMFIKKTKDSIEDYKKYRQAVIIEAVTKGLHENISLKDSGIEWIGKIPEKWFVKKIKNIFWIYSGATPKSGVEEFWDGDIKWITPADYKTEDKYIFGGKRCISQSGYDSCGTTLVDENSIVFSKRAPIGTVAITKEKMCTNQGCLSCVNKENDIVDYFYYLFSVATKEFEVLGTGTTFKEISFDNFCNVKVPVPPIEEQQEIADYLADKCGEIDALITKKEAFVEEMETYKKSLIYEYVTGKKEVK